MIYYYGDMLFLEDRVDDDDDVMMKVKMYERTV